MNSDQIQKALDLFIREFSARYDLGDLGLVVWNKKDNRSGYGLKWTTKDFDVVPRGMMSALVKSLKVQFTMYYKEYITVYVHISYEHHAMGSNGNTEDYRILAERDVLNDDNIIYRGYITGMQSHFISQQDRRILEKAKERDR